MNQAGNPAKVRRQGVQMSVSGFYATKPEMRSAIILTFREPRLRQTGKSDTQKHQGPPERALVLNSSYLTGS